MNIFRFSKKKCYKLSDYKATRLHTVFLNLYELMTWSVIGISTFLYYFIYFLFHFYVILVSFVWFDGVSAIFQWYHCEQCALIGTNLADESS